VRETVHAFVKNAATKFLESRVPIAESSQARPFTPEEREGSEEHRGRCVRFNSVGGGGDLRFKDRWSHGPEFDVTSAEGPLEELRQPPPAEAG
jgi:hypothetical protein